MAGLVGSILVSLGAKTDQFESGMQRARKEVTATADVVAKGSVRFDGLGKSIIGLTATVASLATLKRGLDSVIASGTKMQQLESAFTVLTGSVQASDTVLAKVRATADKLGLSFVDLADGFKGINASAKGTALEGQGVEKVFTQVVTAAKALQLSGDDTTGVLRALQQMLSKGTVQSEELRGQLGERLPGALNIAARALGVTTQELSKMLEQGQIVSASFLPKFANQLEKELGGGAEQASKGFASAMARLGNATFDAGVMVAKSGWLDWLTAVANKMADVIAAAPKAQKKLEELAKAQTQKDVAPLAKAGLSIDQFGQKSLNELNTDIQAQERNAKRLQADILSTSAPQVGVPRSLAQAAVAVYTAELARVQAQIAVMQADKASLIEAMQEAAARPENRGPITGARDDSSIATDLKELAKELTLQMDTAKKAVGQLQERLKIDPENAMEILKEQAELLDKALKTLESTLARSPQLAAMMKGSLGASGGGLSAAEQAAIQRIAAAHGVDPAFLAALRRAENGRAGREFGVLSVPAPTYEDQARIAAQTIKANVGRYPGTATDQAGRYTPGFIDFFSSRYAPQGADNDPTNLNRNHAANLKKFYADAATSGVGGESAAAIAGVGGEAATAMTQVQGLKDQLVALKLQLKDIASADDFLKEIDRLKDALLELQLNDPNDLALAKLQQLQTRAKATQELKAQFAADPSGARDTAFGTIIRLQDQVDEATARKAVRDITQGQHVAVDELIRSLREEERALQATQTELSKTHQGTGAATDAQIAATLALGQATEAEVLNATAIRERNKALKQAIIDIGNQDAVKATIAGLQAERDALLLTDNAKLARTLDKQQATPSDIAQAQGLAAEIKNLQRADQVAGALSNTFEQLALTGKISFASLAQEFGRLAVSILLDASGIKKALTSVAAQGIDWLGTALGALKLAGSASSVTTIGAGAGAEFAAADTGSASTLFDTGGEFRAGGGTVQAGGAYLVGERGAEPFYPSVSGRILSHEEALDALQASRAASAPPAVGEPQTIIQLGGLHIHGVQDTSSFLRSRGEIQRAALQMLQQAQRAA